MTTESDPVLAEMLSLGIPLVRPSFSLADRSDSPPRLVSPPKQPPRGNRRMSVVAGNLNTAPRTTPSLPVVSPRSSEPPSNQPPVLAPLLASPLTKTMPPMLSSPLSKSTLPPPSMHNLTRQSSNEFSDIGEHIAAPSPSRFAMSTGRRNAAVSSGSSGAVSETAASVRTALELLALERNDDGEAFFRALQDKCINAVSKSGTITDATQRVTMLFGQSTSQFNALQTEATSLRSQLYAELKSHVERAKVTQQQLQDAQRRESEFKESLLKQQSIEESLQSQLAQRSSLLNSVRDSFLRQLLALKESIKMHVQPGNRDPVPDPTSPRPALRRAPSFMPAAPIAPEQPGIDWQQLSKFLSDDERSMIALPSSDGQLNTASLIKFLTGSDQLDDQSKPVESGISTQRERQLLEKIQRLELQLHKQHSQMEEVTARAAQTVADQSGLQSRMTEAIQLAKLSEQKLNEVEQLSSKQGARISALQTEVATLKRQATDMRIAFEAEEFRMKKEFVSEIEKLKSSIYEKDAAIALQKEQIQEMNLTQVNSAQSKQLQMRLEALNEALSGGVETAECAVQCTTNNTDQFDELPTLSGVTVLDSANSDTAAVLHEPIKNSPKSSPRAGSPAPSAVRVVVLSCESVATRDNSSVELALIAKLEYLRKINRFDEQNDKNRAVTAGELSQKETLQNDINIAQKQLNQVLDDLRRTQADLVKADAEYQLKLTQLNSIRSKRTNDKSKDQQLEADGRSKMKDGLIAWQLQQITAYEHALREAFGTVRILKTQISAFHLYFDRLQLQPINKQPLDYYHSHRNRRSMGVQASLLIPAPLPAVIPAATPSPSPLTIDPAMSPTNKSADKARSPLSPRGRRTSVGTSPIGSPTSPTADRSPTNDRRALRRGNSKIAATSIMSLVVAEETNDVIGDSDNDDSAIGIEVTPQERKQRTMSDNIHAPHFSLLVADWSSDESDSDTENVEIVSEEQLEKLKAEAAERLKLARSTSMLGVSVEKGASRSDIAAVANATAQLSAQASWWLRKSSDISSLTSPHAVMPTATTAELFATNALASKTQKKGAIDGVIRTVDKRGKTVIRRTPAEQRLVDQRAARVARNWRRMFRYVRLRQAFSGWSADKMKWSLEQTGEVPEQHDEHDPEADSSPLHPSSETITVQHKSSACQTDLTSTEIESLTRRANFKTPDRSFKPTANTPTVALVHMPTTSTAVQPNNGTVSSAQAASIVPSKLIATPATPQADNQYGSPLPSPQGTVNAQHAAEKTSATSIQLDFPDTVSQPTTDSVQVPETPRSASVPAPLIINTDVNSDNFVSDTASPIRAVPSGSPLADDMPEIELDGRFVSGGTQTMCSCACACSDFPPDYRLRSSADATARALSRDRTPLGKLPRKPVQDIIVRPSPVPKVYQAPPMLPAALPLQPLSDVTHSTLPFTSEEQSLSVVDMAIQLGDTADFSRTHRAFHTHMPPKSPPAPPLPRTTPADSAMSPRQHFELQAELSIAPAPTTDNPAAALHTSALLPSPIPIVPIHIVEPISIGLRGSFRRPRTAVNHVSGTVPEQSMNRASTPDPAVAVLDSLQTPASDPSPRIELESTVSIVDVGLVDQPSVEQLSTQVQNHPEQLLLAATTELGDRLLAAFETPAPVTPSQTPTPSSSLWTPRADHVVPARAPANSSYSNRLAQSKLHNTMSEATFTTPTAPTAPSSIAALTSSGLAVQIAKPSRPLSSPLMRHMAISASAMAARHPTSAGTVISSDKQTPPIETGVLMRVSPAPTAQRVLAVPQPPDSARVDELSSPAARSRRLTALKQVKVSEAGKENTATSAQ